VRAWAGAADREPCIHIWSASNQFEESKVAAEIVKQYVDKVESLGEIAVLYRQHRLVGQLWAVGAGSGLLVTRAFGVSCQCALPSASPVCLNTHTLTTLSAPITQPCAPAPAPKPTLNPPHQST